MTFPYSSASDLWNQNREEEDVVIAGTEKWQDNLYYFNTWNTIISLNIEQEKHAIQYSH